MADFVRRGDVVGVQGFPGLLALVSPFVPPCPCVALPVCRLARVSPCPCVSLPLSPEPSFPGRPRAMPPRVYSADT